MRSDKGVFRATAPALTVSTLVLFSEVAVTRGHAISGAYCEGSGDGNATIAIAVDQLSVCLQGKRLVSGARSGRAASTRA